MSNAASDYCQEVTRRSGTSFYFAFRFLPRKQREAIFTVYSLCREIAEDAITRGNQRPWEQSPGVGECCFQ